MDVGVQTFTVRRAQRKSITAAYMPLIEMGIRSFEIARIDFNEKNAEEIKALVNEYGITVSAIQVKPKYVFGAVERIVNFCKITGCKNVVISMLPFECILGGEEKYYAFLDKLDAQFEIYERHGITLAYHHHNWEYVTLKSGKTRMAELLARTKKIKLVHDTYWTARSGIDPVKQIEELGARLLGVHLRDLAHRPRMLDVIPHDTSLGDGLLDFGRIVPAAINAGCAYLVIEQNTKTPYESVKRSYLHYNSITEVSK